ncbi:GNAT family N-acetyltransferase [Planomicrobium sp. CPCC 101110]|uniref:GNAT family N-acetyltransferase n=1 Tax=Planomicrobium sp. CPCC 101110 TaxID=2599619 RepID=UPI0011B6ED1F|nr:GNAT family protein [Planomicrobium sp. CPCC 101110]TWT24922.1 GNAT family N-acetyltransferase [Planomicrobium sp. CPCC 101110]
MLLEQSNVRLRLMNRKDFASLWELYTPGIFEHMLTKIETFEQLTAWLEQGLGKPDVLSFAVENMETSQVIGTTRIYAIDEKNRSCEIGSTFYAEPAQRTHVNTAVKLALLEYCFEECGMIRVQFKTDAENLRSQKALERIGAVKEGVLRNERIRSTGKPRNAVVYSIIDREWPRLKKELTEKLHKYA